MKKHLNLRSYAYGTAIKKYVDYDYIDRLSENDKDWLARFSTEYYKNYFEKGVEHLHKTAEDRTKCYAVGNSARRDISNNPTILSYNSEHDDYYDGAKYE